MYAVEIHDSTTTQGETIDEAGTFDEALNRYADIGWEDEASVLLGRTVIIRHLETGDVWAVGTYSSNPRGSGQPPVLIVLRRQSLSWNTAVICFMCSPDGKVARRDHEVADDLLLPS